MVDSPKTKNKPRSTIRFEREAKALLKNLEKRKQQQKKRQMLKEKKNNGQD